MGISSKVIAVCLSSELKTETGEKERKGKKMKKTEEGKDYKMKNTGGWRSHSHTAVTTNKIKKL